MLIRTAAVLCAASVAFSNVIVSVSAKSVGESNTAEVLLEQSVTSSGFAEVESGTGKAAEVVNRDGKYGWLLNKSDGKDKAYIGFVLDNKFKHEENDGSVYEIEVEYYDTGEGYIAIHYDSYDEPKKMAEAFYTSNEKRWKTVSVTLDDAEFKKHISDRFDFQVSIAMPSYNMPVSTESLAVRRVKVTRHAAVNPIFVSARTNESGNVFRWFDEKKIVANTFTNTTDKELTAEVTYRLIGYKQVKGFEKTETITLKPKEVRETELDFGEAQRCDLYWYEIYIKSADGSINSLFKPLELAIVKTDPNGIKSNVLFQSHYIRYPEEQRKIGMDVHDKSNSGGMRSSWDWYSYERSPGVFEKEKLSDYYINQDAHDKGWFTVTTLGGWGRFHFEKHSSPVLTDEEKEAYRQYVRHAVTDMKDQVDYYEIGNEPNLPNNNLALNVSLELGVTAYLNKVKIAYEEIKRIDPTAKVGTVSNCYVNNEKGMDFFDEYMRQGGWQYMDAYTFHPYLNNYFEKNKYGQYFEYYKKAFKEVGKPDMEFWLTETGYTTVDKTILTKERQGILNSASVIMYNAMGYADMICIYKLDDPGYCKLHREDMFGCTTPLYVDGKKYGTWAVPYISYVMLTATNYMLGETEAIDSKYIDNDNIALHRFNSKKFGKQMLAMYSMEERKDITLDLGTDRIEFYDEYGNSSVMSSENGVYTFTVQNAPTYIVGDIKHVEEAEMPYAEISGFNLERACDDIIEFSMTKNTDEYLTAELELPDCITVSENNGFDGSSAVVKLNNMADEDTECIAAVILKDKNGNARQRSLISVKTLRPINASIKAELGSSKNLNIWSGVMEISNLSFSKPARGYITFKNPDSFAKLSKIDIGVIPSRTTGRVRFALPEIKRKGEYTLEYGICLEGGRTLEFSDKIDFTLAKYADEKPVIDGVIEKNEWSSETMMYADAESQVRQIKDWGGKNDLSAKACVQWDEDNFYLMLEVTDDIHWQKEAPNKTWSGDSVQVGIFYGDEVQVAMGQKYTSFHEICLSGSDEDVMLYRFKSQDDCYEAGEWLDGSDLTVVRGEGKTVYELCMPWEKLLMPGQRPKPGDKLGFSFLVNDNDGGGRRGWIEYASGIGESKNTELFTYLTLLD